MTLIIGLLHLLVAELSLEFTNNYIIMLKRLLLFVALAFPLFAVAQEKKYTLRAGAGYFTDVAVMFPGYSFWVEGGCKLSSGFYLNGRLSTAYMQWDIEMGAFQDQITIDNRTMAHVLFSRPVAISGNHFFEPSIGLLIKRDVTLNPQAELINSTLYYSYSSVGWEMGSAVCADYYYLFNSGLYIGARADINFIFAIGAEGLTLSPVFGFRF